MGPTEPTLFSVPPVPFSVTWPTSGMTRNGALLPLPTSEPATDDSVSSSSPLLPTPNAANATQRSRSAESLARNDHQANLTDLPRLLPTPSASNPNDGEDLEQWEARRERIKAQGKNGNGMGTPLGVAVRKL